MAKLYRYEEVSIDQLVLDDENPRFASSTLVRANDSEVSQAAIIKHLLKYAEIQKLAQRINTVHELHGAELITCYKRASEYVVLEGNRRICACKLLLDRSLVPDEYKHDFPFIEDSTRDNIKSVHVVVYPDREAVQAYLSDRHIAGVKKWSALEKNNYYMDLFQRHKSLEKVKEYTSDTIGVIKRCIIKYQFFMGVFQVLQRKHKNIEVEKLNYLPMVDRFMDVLVGDDSDVGLALSFDEATLRYTAEESKKELYDAILLLVGEAFLLRNDKKRCSGDELPQISSGEITNSEIQKKLILDDKRIPGLVELIRLYKGTPIASDTTFETQADVDDSSRQAGEETNAQSEDNDDNEGSSTYSPNIKYRPQKTIRKYLSFSIDETQGWKLGGGSAYEEKINCLIYDLSMLSVYKHPYACAMLYRALIEMATRLVYWRNATGNKEYDETTLEVNIKYLTHNVIFKNAKGRATNKRKETIIHYTKDNKIIDILNLYIHYEDAVDEQQLLSSWNTMKYYISACVKYV